MANFYRHLKPTCALVRRSFGLLATSSVTCLLSLSSAFLYAAPVTLQFDAIVGPPRQGADAPLPPGWNISLQQGDSISGMFTFEPFDAASNISKTLLVQPFDFSIQIKNRTITTSQYGIEVFNDIFSDELGQQRDRISLGCSAGLSSPSCIPPTVSDTNPLNWTFFLGFEGNSSALDGADISSDPSAWRQLLYPESFGVTFTDNMALRTYGFVASPATLEAMPEPISYVQLLIGTFFLVIAGRHAAESRSLRCSRR
jgi:hypothetical protein